MTDPIAQLCQLITEKLRDEPAVSLVELVAHVEGITATNSELTAALQTHQRMIQINQDGANFQTLVDGGIANIGTHYHIPQKKLEKALKAILGNLQPPFEPEIEAVKLKGYLQSLRDDPKYREWQDFYTSLRAEKVKSSAEQESRKTAAPQEQIEQWDDALAGLRHYSENHVLLVGKPGSGKSTALRQLLWEEAHNALAAIDQGKTGFKIPVLIELRDHKEEDIAARIQKILRRTGLDGAAIEKLLLAGRFFLLFDGLNEIPSPTVWAKLDEFQRDRDFRENSRVFTTRELGADAELKLKEKLTLLPLTELQMQLFVEKRLPGKTEVLLNQLQDRLKELAETPLLLKILCDVVRESPNGDLPSNRGELFRRKFARRYQAFKPKRGYISEDSRRLTENLLQYLAFKMTEGKSFAEAELQLPKERATKILQEFLRTQSEVGTLTKASEYLEDLLEWNLLQIASDANEVEFHHQLFQEYYAAEYLLQLLLPLLKDEDKLKRDYLNLLKWTEPIALMLSLLTDKDQTLRVVQLALDVDLRLGARLAGEAALAFHEATIGEIIGLSVTDWLKVELLGKTRSEMAIPELRSFLRHPSINIAEAAAYYIGETQNQADIDILIRRLDEISNKFFSQKSYGGNDKTGALWTTHVQALAYLAPQEATKFLNEKLKEHGTVLLVVTRAASILMQLGAKKIIPELLKDFRNAQHEENKKIAAGQKELEEEIQIPDLVESAVHENARTLKTIRLTPPSPEFLQRNHILNLLKNSTDYELFVPDLIQVFEQEPNQSIRREIIQVLGRSKHDTAVHLLVKKLGEASGGVRSEAAKQLLKLKNIDNPQNLEELENLAKHEDWNISWYAALVLGYLRDFTVLPRMMHELENHEMSNVRSTAAGVLGIIGDSSCVPSLLKTINSDSDRYVRINAACSLSYFEQKEAIPILLDSLKAPTNADPHAEIIKSLARFSLKEPLLEIIQAKKPDWQRAAIELGNLVKFQGCGESDILPVLFKALENPVYESSSETIVLLSELADSETLNCLINALEYPKKYTQDIYFPNRVALVLVRCSPEKMTDVLPALKALSKICNIPQLSWLVPTIQNRCKFYNYDICKQPSKIANS